MKLQGHFMTAIFDLHKVESNELLLPPTKTGTFLVKHFYELWYIYRYIGICKLICMLMCIFTLNYMFKFT